MTRQRVTLELDPELVDLVRQLAQELGISMAGVVDRLLLDGLERWASGEVDFDRFLQPTSQGRYRWVVEIDPNGLHEQVSHRLTIT
jgi:hypothetical protein